MADLICPYNGFKKCDWEKCAARMWVRSPKDGYMMRVCAIAYNGGSAPRHPDREMRSNEQMAKQEAIRLLHPDTTREAIAEIEYYGGFSGPEKAIKAIEEACALACEALKKAEMDSLQ